MGQQARWLAFMEQFLFDVVHRAATRHGNTDGLSRRPAGDNYEIRGVAADKEESMVDQPMPPA